MTMKKLFSILLMGLSISFVSCKKDKVDDGGQLSNSDLLNGDWTITHIEYDTELDLSVIDASILDAVQPGLSLIVPSLAPIRIDGEAENAGTYSLNESEFTYTSDLEFTTEPITIVTFELPGLPIDFQSEGTWELQNNDEELVFVDNATGAEQIYDIENLTDKFALLRGMLVISQDVPALGTYEFEVELDLTLER